MPQPGQPIELSEQTEERLAGCIAEIIDDLELDHKDHFNSLDVWRDWYEAKPVSEVRQEPWPNASNIVAPIIKVASDGIVARLHGRVHTPTRTWVGKSLNPEYNDCVSPLSDDLNWRARNQFDIEGVTLDWFNEMVPFGSSVVKLAYTYKYEFRFAPGKGGVKYVKVERSRGPSLTHIPREYLLWTKDRTILESEVLVHQSPMTWNDITHHVLCDGWDEDEAAECRSQGGIDGMPGTILQNKRELEGVAGAKGLMNLHDIREVWLELSVAKLAARGPSGMDPSDLDFEDEAPIPIVVTYHRKARKILRVIAHPYFFSHFPFYDIYYRKRSGRGSSAGIAKMLEHIQRGVTTSINQATDAITLANSITVVTQDAKFNSWKFSPGRPIMVRNIQDIQFPTVGKQIMPDVMMVNLLTNIGERLTGINDPALGQETRMGGHPSPATSTLTMLQEANKLHDMTLRGVRRQLSRIPEDIATMLQQYETNDDGLLESVHGPENAKQIQKILFPPDIPVGGNIHFDLFAMSEYLNPDTQIQRAVLVDQYIGQYYAFVQQALMVIGSQNPQINPAVKQAMVKALEAKTATARRFLESNEIDDIEKYILAARSGQQQDSASVQDAFEQAQAAAQQQLGPGSMGASPGGPGGPEEAGGVPGMGIPTDALASAPAAPPGVPGGVVQ